MCTFPQHHTFLSSFKPAHSCGDLSSASTFAFSFILKHHLFVTHAQDCCYQQWWHYRLSCSWNWWCMYCSVHKSNAWWRAWVLFELPAPTGCSSGLKCLRLYVFCAFIKLCWYLYWAWFLLCVLQLGLTPRVCDPVGSSPTALWWYRIRLQQNLINFNFKEQLKYLNHLGIQINEFQLKTWVKNEGTCPIRTHLCHEILVYDRLFPKQYLRRNKFE